MHTDPGPARPRLFSATTSKPPAWLLGAKACLLGLLVVGAAFPEVGGFAGKGMLFRLPPVFAPSLILPGVWLARRRRAGEGAEPVRYQAALDAGLTLPFLADTAANAVGLYDSFGSTDNYLHLINWFILFGGVACAFSERVSRVVPSWLVVIAAGGNRCRRSHRLGDRRVPGHARRAGQPPPHLPGHLERSGPVHLRGLLGGGRRPLGHRPAPADRRRPRPTCR